MQEIVGGDERVVGGVEVQEPVPALADLQQQRSAVQRGGERGRAAGVGEPWVADDVDVAGAAGAGAHLAREAGAVGGGGGAVEEEEVEVAGVVGGEEQAEEAFGVPRGASEEECERGRGRAGGGGVGVGWERGAAERVRRSGGSGGGGGGEEVEQEEEQEGGEEEAGERAGVLGEDGGGRRGRMHG